MLDNLRELAGREAIDVVMIWLGANDCLPARLELGVEDMPANYVGRDPLARRTFNLTSEAQFDRDFAELVAADFLEPRFDVDLRADVETEFES